MLKRKIIYQRLQKILSKNSILFIYHYNNLSTKQWALLKNKLSKIDGINTMVIQNKIMKDIFNSSTNDTTCLKKLPNYSRIDCSKETVLEKSDIKYFTHQNIVKLQPLFQGPTFLVACNSYNQIPLITKIFQNYPNFIFIGGFLETQTITHVDLQKYLTLNTSSYQYFLTTLLEKPKWMIGLKTKIDFSVLDLLQYRLVYLLDRFANK